MRLRGVGHAKYMSERSPEELNSYRRGRIAALVSKAREPLGGYMDRLDNDTVLERLDRAIAKFDVLLLAREQLTVQLGAIGKAITTATAEGESNRELRELGQKQQCTVEQLQDACAELNSAIANAQMYSEIATERGLL